MRCAAVALFGGDCLRAIWRTRNLILQNISRIFSQAERPPGLMTPMNPGRPLDNFPVVRTNDIEQVCEALSRIYVGPTRAVSPPDVNFRAAINDCQLNNVRLSYCSFGAPFSLEFPTANYFWQMIPVQGQGEVVSQNATLSLFAGTTATMSPESGFQLNLGADYEAFVFKIDKWALTNKLVALTGATVNEPLRIESGLDSKRPVAKILQEYLPILANTLSNAVAPLPSWWETQTEQLLMTMFLCAHRHNYSHLLDDQPTDAALWQIRRVEEFVEANWQRPITLEDLADVAGVSAFSVFRSFKKYRGYSPLEFAAHIRARRRSS